MQTFSYFNDILIIGFMSYKLYRKERKFRFQPEKLCISYRYRIISTYYYSSLTQPKLYLAHDILQLDTTVK